MTDQPDPTPPSEPRPEPSAAPEAPRPLEAAATPVPGPDAPASPVLLAPSPASSVPSTSAPSPAAPSLAAAGSAAPAGVSPVAPAPTAAAAPASPAPAAPAPAAPSPAPGAPLPVRRPAPPQARVSMVAPPPSAPLPWASVLCDALMLALAVAVWRKIPVFDATVLSPDLPRDPAHLWRLVTATFVHGPNMVFPALSALGLVWTWGMRSERAFGSSGMLTTLLVGGAVGNLVRCFAEDEQFLAHAGSGGVAAGIALAGATVSGVVRSREGGIFSTLVQALGSAAFGVLFSLPAWGAGVAAGDTVVRLLPAVGVAFVLGGFLGIVLPLRTSERARPIRAGLLVLALATVAVAGAFLARAAWPSSSSSNEPPKKRPGPPMARHESTELDLSYELPLFLSEQRLAKAPTNGAAKIYARTFGGMPHVFLHLAPKHEFYAADTTALQVADQIKADEPGAKLLSEGKLECPLGPAYFVALSLPRDDEPMTLWDCFVVPQAGSNMVEVQLRAEPGDDGARPILEAIVRSLKVLSAPADKEVDPKQRGRPR